MSYHGQRANTAYIHLPASSLHRPYGRVHIDPTVSMLAEVVACGKSTVNGNYSDDMPSSGRLQLL